uniref:Glucan endo-1,3-alpha-glucosidase agn1 n=1 Tax=Anthurium amnicola TaxID=1678845 RepID=A0A1D1ZAN8_9ARAE
MRLALILGRLLSPFFFNEYAATIPKSVFAHVVVGILSSYTQSQWAQEISDAKACGIDAFALNIGKDSYTETQLGYAYAAAQADGNFKMFISFDFAYYSLPSDNDRIVQLINSYASSPAQYKVDGKPLVTTFIGDNQDWSNVKSRTNCFLAPNWADPNSIASNAQADAGYPWNAWGTVNNSGVPDPNANLVEQDSYWEQVLGSKVYFAPVSPWFFTHYAPNSYDKNWIFPTEDLYLTRWKHLLNISPSAIYQLTWNDYSESTYIAPLRSDPNLYPAGASAWTNGMPHDGFRLIQNAFIKAYKAGASSPIISGDNIVYWYRIQSKDAQCNDPTGRPDAYQYVSDTLFITTLLTSPAQLVVTSGGQTSSYNVDAGAVMTKVPILAGQQSLSLVRNGVTVRSGTSPRPFTTDCPANVYNFNSYVGVI